MGRSALRLIKTRSLDHERTKLNMNFVGGTPQKLATEIAIQHLSVLPGVYSNDRNRRHLPSPPRNMNFLSFSVRNFVCEVIDLVLFNEVTYYYQTNACF